MNNVRRRPRVIEKRVPRVLSEECRAALIAGGGERFLTNQFVINRLMELDDWVKKHPLPSSEELRRLFAQAQAESECQSKTAE